MYTMYDCVEYIGIKLVLSALTSCQIQFYTTDIYKALEQHANIMFIIPHQYLII